MTLIEMKKNYKIIYNFKLQNYGISYDLFFFDIYLKFISFGNLEKNNITTKGGFALKNYLIFYMKLNKLILFLDIYVIKS